MMSILYVLIGPPGVGKSTWIKEKGPNWSKDSVTVCRDEIQLMLHSGDYGKYWNPHEGKSIKHLIDTIESTAVMSALVAGIDVFLDRTSMDRDTRSKYLRCVQDLQLVQPKDYKTKAIALDFLARLDHDQQGELVTRRLRDGRGQGADLWQDVIHDMISRYEPALLEDGFDQVIEVDPSEVGLVGAEELPRQC